jgi:hypothetical protein
MNAQVTPEVLDRSIPTYGDRNMWGIYAAPNNWTIADRPIDMLAKNDYNVAATLEHILATSGKRDLINDHILRSLSRSLYEDLYACAKTLQDAYNG